MADSPTDAWDSFLQSLSSFQTGLSRSRAILVSTGSLRGNAKYVVQQYFRQARPHLIALQFSAQEIGGLDGEMQSLLRLSNGRNRKQSYVQLLRRTRGYLQDIEATREMRLGQGSIRAASDTPKGLSPVEARIIGTLEKLVPSAALSCRQAILDLSSGDRLSFRGTANELREALREVLDHLAPDSEVMQAEGFKLEANTTKPTQRQKVRHILRARRLPRTAAKPAEDAVVLVEEFTASVTRSTYERSNLSTHTATTRREVQQMKMYVDSVLAELLEIHKE